MKHVIWMHFRGCWKPVMRSLDVVELTEIAAACVAEGFNAIVLPSGEAPCDA